MNLLFRPSLLLRNLAATAFLFFLLQIWRPYFFLTDDNLVSDYPFFMEVGHHLLAGHSPFYSEHIYGGHYNLLHDASLFFWHPLYLLVSLLAGTRFHLCTIDVDAFCLLLLTASGFTVLAQYLRREESLQIGDYWITFFCLSFTYSLMAVTSGASWLLTLGTQSALPWLVLGILHRKAGVSAGLIFSFGLHQLFGGPLWGTLSTLVFLSIFSVGVCFVRRSFRPLACWTFGLAAVLIVALPLLLPMLDGFLQSERAAGQTVAEMQACNIPFPLLPMSLFLGVFLYLHSFISGEGFYTCALGACAGAWCLIPAIATRGRWSRLEILCLGMLGLIALFVSRPNWLSEILNQVPLLKSMRWPFREMLPFLFFLHLFLVVRQPGLNARWRSGLAIFGALMLLVPLRLLNQPPTFNGMPRDRDLLLSGRAEVYWARVLPLLKPDDRVAVLIPLEAFDQSHAKVPQILLGTFNYAMLFNFVNASGYSSTPPRTQLYTTVRKGCTSGAFTPDQRGDLLKEHPDLRFITLESLEPLHITLSSATGPAVDITPFVPPEKAQ